MLDMLLYFPVMKSTSVRGTMSLLFGSYFLLLCKSYTKIIRTSYFLDCFLDFYMSS